MRRTVLASSTLSAENIRAINNLGIKELTAALKIAFIDACTGNQNIVYNREDTFRNLPRNHY